MTTKTQTIKMEAQETIDTKTCSQCGKVKLLLDFSVNVNGRKFVNPSCKECSNKRARENAMLRDFGLTLLQYDLILLDQDGSCKICGKKKSGGLGRFHVDHNHKTGKIRGLLCNKCNPMLGHAHDDPKILIAAANYLIESRK